jgi:hypothetical protein
MKTTAKEHGRKFSCKRPMYYLWVMVSKTQILKCSDVKSFLLATALKDDDLAGVF